MNVQIRFRRKGNMTKHKKIIGVIVMLVLLALLTGGMYLFSIYHSTQAGNLDLSKLSIREGLDEGVINIAVFGIDGRDDPEVDGDRSDVIMIATLDTKNNKVKLTSIMRDTFVCIDDDGDETWQKINAAYSLGGEELTIKTINQCFDMNISEYATVDFNAVMDVVDALGGITINIQNEDILYWTNQYLGESNTFGNRNDPPLTELGEQTVTGAQALAYSRNRYSDSDYGRTARQREVVYGIFEKAKSLDLLNALNLVSKLAPYLKTSLDMGEMTDYAKVILASNDISFEDFRLPTDAFSLGGTLDGTWYLFPNTLVDNARVLHEFIYGEDTDFTASDTLQEISDRIAYYAHSCGAEQISTEMASTGISDTFYETTDTTSTEDTSDLDYSDYDYDVYGDSQSNSYDGSTDNSSDFGGGPDSGFGGN